MPTSTLVVKYGGHAMDDPALCLPFAKALAQLCALDMRCVVVHGGGPHINALLKRLHIESRFVNGLRVTDTATMEVVEMVLCGQVNKAVVTLLQQADVNAVGMCGKDGGLLHAHVRDPAFGLVGDVHTVNARVLDTLLDAGFVPVVAPVALGPAETSGASLNVNADTAAGAIAGALCADYFVLISDVPGVLDAKGTLLPCLSRAEIETHMASGVIHGGMIPKVKACLHALNAGCRKALILDGRAQSSLARFLLHKEPLGTVVEA